MTGKHTARYRNLAIVSLSEIWSERGGPGKLRSHWEEQIYITEKRIADSPVYRVRTEVGRGKQRLLHRNFPFLVTRCHLKPHLPSRE